MLYIHAVALQDCPMLDSPSLSSTHFACLRGVVCIFDCLLTSSYVCPALLNFLFIFKHSAYININLLINHFTTCYFSPSQKLYRTSWRVAATLLSSCLKQISTNFPDMHVKHLILLRWKFTVHWKEIWSGFLPECKLIKEFLRRSCHCKGARGFRKWISKKKTKTYATLVTYVMYS